MVQNNMYQWIHELIFGALAVNIALFFGIIKSGWKVYKTFCSILEQHETLYQDYLYREKLRDNRVQGNADRKAAKIHKRQEHERLYGPPDDSSA